MKKCVLQKMAGALAVCVLSMLGMQNAYAQVTLGYNSVLGNQSGTNGNFQIISSSGDGPYIHMFTNDNNNGSGGSMNFIAGYSPDANRAVFSFQVRDASVNANWAHRLDILQSGAVRIGGEPGNNSIPIPQSVSNWKLAVAGRIVAQAIYVTSPNVWADFVFERGYKSMSLPTLESYLLKNKHLPNVPSAKQVEAQGYDVTAMDAKLLQSLEELTLHVIALNKQNAQLQAQVKTLRLQVKAVSRHRKSN